MSEKLAKQLTKTQQELSELKAEYDEFTYIISHDLSAPLRQIGGFIELVVANNSESFDDKTKRHIELALGGTAQAKRMLDALVNYSRVTTTTEPYALLDINKLVIEAQDELSTMIAETNAVINCENLPKIKGREAQIKQLFFHLIQNALLYQSPQNSPEITIKVIEVNENWQFCIKDNGIGVADKLQEKIFKVLRRAVSDKKYAGIGMGLALAKKILQSHEGSIWLESEEGVGSSFYFTIAKDLPL